MSVSPSHTYDVVVVGAGLSGLQAAVTCHQKNLSCLVLEASNRIGGKVKSVPVSQGDKATVDVGPAWINDTSQSYMFALGQKYEAEFQVQRDEGDEIFESQSGVIVRRPRGTLEGSEEEQTTTLKLITAIDEIGKQIKQEESSGPISSELDKVDSETWIKRQTNDLEHALSLMNFLIRSFVGAEARDISALYMLRLIESGTGFENIAGTAKDSGQYLRPKQGCQVFVNGLASELPENAIQTSNPVTSITQHETHCTVATSSGSSYDCKKAIVSVPTPLYRHIAFTPPLPQMKHTLAESTRLGYYTKAVATYSSPWWRAAGLAGEMQSHTDAGPINLVADTSVDSQSQFSLSLFMVSNPGRAWSLLSESDRRNAALNHLGRLFEPFIDGNRLPEPTDYVEMDWSKEQWFEGAPGSLYPVGVMTSDAGKSLREKFGLIHFVGTEMSDVWEGYMEGAVREGERGALEVVKALSG